MYLKKMMKVKRMIVGEKILIVDLIQKKLMIYGMNMNI